MTRSLHALAATLLLALPTQALPVPTSLPHLTFPDPVTTPSTKGCDAAQTTEACPAQS